MQWVSRHSLVLGIFVASLFPAQRVLSQDIEQVEAELIDQQPFDLITLTDDAGGDQVKVNPLDFPGRIPPTNPKPTDKLEVVLIKYPDRLYEVMWRDVAKIGIYEQRIYDEAIEKMDAKDFVVAFRNLSFLMKNYPGMPRLENLRQEFIYKSAIDRFGRGELRQTLSALEELRESAPGFRANDVSNAMSRVASRLIGEYQENGNLGNAQALLNRMKAKYGPSLAVVQEWENKLKQMALAKKAEAERLVQEKRYREARKAALEMLSIFPDLPDGQQLIREINETHPMVRVGVMQRSGDLDPSSLVDWPARRAGTLPYRALFQFLETGTEGGDYRFALGNYESSDDRQQLILQLDDTIQNSLNSFGLAQELLQRAEPGHETYDPSWAAIFDSVATRGKDQVLVNLKRPNVLPHALLQWILPDSPDQPGGLPGVYRVDVQDGKETAFKLRPGMSAQGGPVEVIEVFYDDAKEAVNDLLRGEIDILDQLYPADARRLASNSRLSIGSYALPTTHMLIPVSDHEFLARVKFRRAMLYATNRQAMLTGELLNSTNPQDGRLVSGPFPIGDGESDTLAYAYDSSIEPIGYSPHLARLLVVMTRQELGDMAERKGEPIPEYRPIVVGCPDFEFARVAVQAMIQQWANVGIQAEMVVLESGDSEKRDECDLLYVITTMWEPATDIERLLGGNGIARSDDPFVVQALAKLRRARNWREVRTALQEIHQLIDFHLPLIPLWQITDRFAVSRFVEGMDKQPVSLYQNVDTWRLDFGAQIDIR